MAQWIVRPPDTDSCQPWLVRSNIGAACTYLRVGVTHITRAHAIYYPTKLAGYLRSSIWVPRLRDRIFVHQWTRGDTKWLMLSMLLPAADRQPDTVSLSLLFPIERAKTTLCSKDVQLTVVSSIPNIKRQLDLKQ